MSLNQQQFIQMGERLATAAVRILALGEAAASPMSANVALDDYRVTKSVIVGGKPARLGPGRCHVPFLSDRSSA